MRRPALGLVIGLGLLLATNANAQSNNALSRKSLEGISAFGVVVDDVSEDLQASGLSRSVITSDVELRLRRQGLRILDEDGLGKEPGGPYLHIIVLGKKTSSPQILGFVISVQFEQAVLPTRYIGKAGENPRLDKSVFAATWGVNGLGSAGTDTIARVIRDGLAVFVDQFVNAYLAANPQR